MPTYTITITAPVQMQKIVTVHVDAQNESEATAAVSESLMYAEIEYVAEKYLTEPVIAQIQLNEAL